MTNDGRNEMGETTMTRDSGVPWFRVVTVLMVAAAGINFGMALERHLDAAPVRAKEPAVWGAALEWSVQEPCPATVRDLARVALRNEPVLQFAVVDALGLPRWAKDANRLVEPGTRYSITEYVQTGDSGARRRFRLSFTCEAKEATRGADLDI